MSICVRNRKETSEELLELIIEFNRVTVCKISTQNQLYVDTNTCNQQPEHEIRKGNLEYVVSSGPACNEENKSGPRRHRTISNVYRWKDASVNVSAGPSPTSVKSPCNPFIILAYVTIEIDQPKPRR